MHRCWCCCLWVHACVHSAPDHGHYKQDSLHDSMHEWGSTSNVWKGPHKALGIAASHTLTHTPHTTRPCDQTINPKTETKMYMVLESYLYVVLPVGLVWTGEGNGEGVGMSNDGVG